MQPSIDNGTLIGGRWRVTSLLGQGGFGQVFRCDDESTIGLGSAAVKVLHPNTSPQERGEFLDEVKKIAGLRHPNLVGYLDSGVHEIDGVHHPYLVTELCDGSLADHLGQLSGGGMEQAAAIGALGDISAGLAHLHARGLIHRDIKPGNVLLGGGNWKLADFGLMRDLTATGSYHRGDAITGTPLFMAPELFVTMTATAPSDVYALGVVAHMMLTGQTIYTGSGPALIHAITTGPPTIAASVAPAMADLISSAVDRDPTQRISAQQFHQRLQNTLSDWAPPPSPRLQVNAPTAPASQLPAPPAAPGFETALTGPPTGSGMSFEPAVLGQPPVPQQASQPVQPGPMPPINGPGGPPTARTNRALPIILLLVAVGFVGLLVLGVLALFLMRSTGDVGQGTTIESGSTDSGDESGVETGSTVSGEGDGVGGDGVDIGEDVVIGDDVQIGGDEGSGTDSGSGSNSDGPIDPDSHLTTQPCVDAMEGQLLVTNTHTSAVDYVAEVEHFDAAGVRIDETRDTVQALDPGRQATLGIESVEEGGVSCELTSFVVTETPRILVEQRSLAEIISCEPDGGWHRIVLSATNPLPREVTAEVYVAVVDENGLRLDEDWAGATIYDIREGQTARTEESEAFWNLDAFDQPTVDCVVVAVEFD